MSSGTTSVSSVGSGTIVVLAVDERYSAPACALLASIAQHATPSVVVIDCGLAASTRAHLPRFGGRLGLELAVLPVPPTHLRLLHRMPVSGYFSPATWARILLPDILHHVNQCLYLDSDLIVQADISPLLEVKCVKGKIAAAAPDEFIATFGSPLCSLGMLGDREWRKLPYFNAGVLVLDLAALREEEAVKELVALAMHPPVELWCVDQDVLNLYLARRWCVLDRAWNTVPIRAVLDWEGWVYHGGGTTTLRGRERAVDGARILHFVSSLKPWMGAYPPTPARRVYQHAAHLATEAWRF